MLLGVKTKETEYVYCCQRVRTDLQNDAVTPTEIYATEPKRPETAPRRFPATAAAARLGSWRLRNGGPKGFILQTSQGTDSTGEKFAA